MKPWGACLCGLRRAAMVAYRWVSPLALAALACSQAGQQARRFESEEISFDYPPGWQTIDQVFPGQDLGQDRRFNAQEIAIVVDPDSSTPWEKYTVAVHLLKKTLPPNASLEELFHQTYAEMPPPLDEVSESRTTLGALPALEKVYRQPLGEPWIQLRDLWVERERGIYILSCQAFPADFDKLQADFATITDSLAFIMIGLFQQTEQIFARDNASVSLRALREKLYYDNHVYHHQHCQWNPFRHYGRHNQRQPSGNSTLRHL